jgi:hypothetical protein
MPPSILVLLGCFCLALAALGKERTIGTDDRRNLLQLALGGRLDWLPNPVWAYAQLALGLGFLATALAEAR